MFLARDIGCRVTGVDMNEAGIRAGERCRLLVVARDGTQEVAGSWVVSGAPGGATLDGSAAIALSDVKAVVVQNEAGQEFVRAVV